MTNHKISIAMCTFNGARYLQAQLDSIASQTRSPDEVVICDDRSDDGTSKILQRFASRVPFTVRVFFNHTALGSTKNFEKAIRLCRGDIISLSDQDDVWDPEKLARMEAIFLQSPAVGLVFTDAVVVDEYLLPLNYRLWESIRFTNAQRKRVARGDATRVLLKHNVVTGATMAFRAKYNDLILPFPSQWIHDTWIAFLISVEADLAFIDKPLIKYRQHRQNQIGAVKRDLLAQMNETYKFGKDHYLALAEQWLMVYERMEAQTERKNGKEKISEVVAKIHHLKARAQRPNAMLGRISVAVSELITLRYHRFSNGWKSMAKDLVLRFGTRQ